MAFDAWKGCGMEKWKDDRTAHDDDRVARDYVGRGSRLRSNMIADDPNRDEIADAIARRLCEHQSSGMHNRHLSHSELLELGMQVRMLGDEDDVQDAVLSVHHAYMTTPQRVPTAKIIEGSSGKRWVIRMAG